MENRNRNRNRNRQANVYLKASIEDINCSVILSAGYDRKKDEYYMVSIEFTKEHSYGPNFWDNGNYIFETFYPMLKRYVECNLTSQDTEEFESFIMNVNEEEVLDIIDIIEEGIDWGWNKAKL